MRSGILGDHRFHECIEEGQKVRPSKQVQRSSRSPQCWENLSRSLKTRPRYLSSFIVSTGDPQQPPHTPSSTSHIAIQLQLAGVKQTWINLGSISSLRSSSVLHLYVATLLAPDVRQLCSWELARLGNLFTPVTSVHIRKQKVMLQKLDYDLNYLIKFGPNTWSPWLWVLALAWLLLY